MANNCMLLILTLSNRALKIHVSTDTSWTKVLPQTGRALGLTGSPCSCAAGSAVSTGWGRQRSETEIRTFGSLCEKGPEFLTAISGQCQEEEVAQGKALCHCHTQALHRNLPLHPHFSSWSTNPSGRGHCSFPDEPCFWSYSPASEQETVESHSHPAVPPRACKTNAIVPPPSPTRLRHVLQVQPPDPSRPGGGREQTQNPTSTRELISLF